MEREGEQMSTLLHYHLAPVPMKGSLQVPLVKHR